VCEPSLGPQGVDYLSFLPISGSPHYLITHNRTRRIYIEFSRSDLDIDAIVERQVKLTAYDDFRPSSSLESVTLKDIRVQQAPRKGKSGIAVNVTLHGLQPFSHFQITIVCKLRTALTEAVFLAYLTTPGSRPPPPLIIEVPEGLIAKDSLPLRSDPPAVTVGILDHVIVEVHDTNTNTTAFEVFTNGYSMATCLGRYDPYPTTSIYIQRCVCFAAESAKEKVKVARHFLGCFLAPC